MNKDKEEEVEDFGEEEHSLVEEEILNIRTKGRHNQRKIVHTKEMEKKIIEVTNQVAIGEIKKGCLEELVTNVVEKDTKHLTVHKAIQSRS